MQVGGGGVEIFTVYVPLTICEPGLVQLSCQVTLNVQLPEDVGVPDIVAPEAAQLKFSPLQLAGVHCVFV